MSKFDEQLKVVWILLKQKKKKLDEVFSVGGALCISKNGLLITTHEAVGKKELWESNAVKIQARSYDEFTFRDLDYLHEFPALNIAILKIKPKPKNVDDDDGVEEEFMFRNLGSELILDAGEPLVAHGHAAGIPYSSWFGSTSYAYRNPNDLAIRLIEPDRKFKDTDVVEECEEEIRFRTVAGVASRGDKKLLYDMHPHLPLVEQGTLCLRGYSGSPVFRISDGGLVGIFSFPFPLKGCSYIVPVDVVHYVVSKLTDLSS